MENLSPVLRPQSATYLGDKWQNGCHKYEPTVEGAIFYIGNKSGLPRVALGKNFKAYESVVRRTFIHDFQDAAWL